MVQLSCDGSFKDGIGGMAVIAPKGLPAAEGVTVRIIAGEELEAHVASARCASAMEAETMALAMAAEIAATLLVENPSERVEIATDSLANLKALLQDEGKPRGMERLKSLMRDSRQRISLSKVKAHRGNKGNELADRWSRLARKEAERRSRYEAPSAEGREKGRAPMRNPYRQDLYGNKERGYDVTKDLVGFDGGPYGKPTEADILRQTREILDGEDYVAVITRDGRIMPKNSAHKEGEQDPTHLIKDRVWG